MGATTRALTSTRSRLVESARELFHERGYRATSLAVVAERADANPGSLYYFFRTKEDLLAAVLDRYHELLGPMVMEPALSASDDPIEQVFAVLDGYRRTLVETDFEIGCPIGNLALETRDVGVEVRRRISGNLKGWTACIESCLDGAGSRLPGELDRRRLAQFVLTVMEGAVLQARGHGTIEPFDEAVLQLRDHIGRLQAAALKERAPQADR